MHIGRHLVLSTAHVRCATAELLENWSRLPARHQPLAVASTQYGWFVETRQQKCAQTVQLPEELPAILAFGRGHDCTYILLDCDGPEEGALPRYPW